MYYPYYLFGCVAILVNPNDKRYKKIRSKEVILPITNRQVPIIPYD
jgi:valyl-tRNA synthetase